MIDATNDDKGFKPNTTFEHVYALYDFDKQLRDLTLQALVQFEQIFKQNFAYVVARDISDNQSRYTANSHYNTGKTHRYHNKISTDRDGLLRNFKRTLNSQYQPHNYYREVHGNIPPWIMVKNFTFGNSIYWFRLSKKSIRESLIARLFGISPDMYSDMNKLFDINQAFGDLLALYLDYRNLTAHGGRVYNHRSKQHEIRHYSRFIYRDNILPVSKRQFNKSFYRSSIGTVYRTLSSLNNKDPYMEIHSWLIVRLESYLRQYPEDQQYLIDEMELGITDIPGILTEDLKHYTDSHNSN